MARTQVFFVLTVATVLSWAVASATAAPVESHDDLVADAAPEPTLRIEAQLDGGKWRRKAAVAMRAEQRLALRVSSARCADDEHDGAQVRWYLAFADTTREYQNANKPWEPDPGEWTGFDTIAYYRVELETLRGRWEVRPFEEVEDLWSDARAFLRGRGARSEAVSYYVDGLGTFWFEAEVERDGELARTWGVRDTDRTGLSTRVFRVSVRADDSYLGYLTGYYNVPSVFGSVTKQGRNHLAVDCADVLVAAHAEWRDEPIGKNVNVAMVAKLFDERAELDMANGVTSSPLRWGQDIEPGDLIAVRYDAAWSTRYNHIGALAGDTDGDGVLGPADEVLHAGPEPLHREALAGGAFDGHVVIVRPD